MEQITSDKLFQILHQVRHYPELLIGKKSLVALESYIRGYVDACREHSGDCSTVRWYNAFCDYIAQRCGIKDKFFCVSYAIESMGYNDSDGVSFFMELLEQFFREYDDYVKEQEKHEKLRNGEIRVFRLDKMYAMELSSQYVQEHCKELFGISPDAEQYTWVFNWNPDQTLTCALCQNRQSAVVINQEDSEVASKIKELPVFSVAEKVKYTMI